MINGLRLKEIRGFHRSFIPRKLPMKYYSPLIMVLIFSMHVCAQKIKQHEIQIGVSYSGMFSQLRTEPDVWSGYSDLILLEKLNLSQIGVFAGIREYLDSNWFLLVSIDYGVGNYNGTLMGPTSMNSYGIFYQSIHYTYLASQFGVGYRFELIPNKLFFSPAFSGGQYIQSGDSELQIIPGFSQTTDPRMSLTLQNGFDLAFDAQYTFHKNWSLSFKLNRLLSYYWWLDTEDNYNSKFYAASLVMPTLSMGFNWGRK